MATMCFESMSGCDFPHDYEDSFADTLKMPPLDESLLLNDNDMVGFEDLVFVGRKEQSIRGDVAKIAAERSSWMLDDLHDIIDIKPDIRNGDCMWSSFGSANTCNNNSSSNNGCNGANNSACNGGNSAASSYSESSAVPPAIVSCSGTMMIKHEMTEDDEDDVVDEDDNDDDDEEENCNSSNNNNSNNSNSNNTSSNICSNKLTTFATSARITIRPNKSATQMRYNNNNTTSYSSNNNNNVEQHIPPGASLLRKSNPSTAVSATALKLKQQYHSLNRRSSPKESSSTFVFPDPPQQDNSKEDASMAPVFRHNVDLAACLVGSNNISLTSSSEPNYHIDHISRELQNGKSRFDLYHSNYQPQISDVLDVISQQVTADAAAISASSSSGSSAAAATTSTTMSPPASNSDCDSDDGDCSMVDSNCGSSSYMRHISDHSYTRSEMETNLETPSDSDEEIDVVSLNDKTLPTNPSDRDRRALQTKVANKISTIPPPRRGRYELPYTPASSSPVKSEANSRFPSPSSTPYQNSGAAVATVYSPLLLRNTSSGSSSSSSSSSAGSDCATSTMLWEGSSSSSINNKSSRKRYQDTCRSSGAFSKQLQASKKSRAKLSNNSVLSTAHPGAQLKQQQHTLGANSSSSSSSASSNSANNSNVNFSVMKRQFSLDEADTIEKRNLHNDMERQRRIGLKNLFEALKKQIPNIRDKERAPKVNILREAAKLCEQLTNEERELSLKRQLLKAQLKQRQEKIARLRLSMNAAE